MKKLVSVLLCLMLVLGCVSVAGAEAFDPTANIWFLWSETGILYIDGFEAGYYEEYRQQADKYVYFKLNPDGTGSWTLIFTPTSHISSSDLTWTQPTETSLQLVSNDTAGTTFQFEYRDGELHESIPEEKIERVYTADRGLLLRASMWTNLKDGNLSDQLNELGIWEEIMGAP
ncbi:MAG: hypothetical protein IJX84_02995 [Clostridia bacterium]|nr:hypothetical protein [Clostridia bacterium]